ncbi:hypothetical protein P691DRAFT_397435 [Macrolepiota fuliginosa MF-IS2]|uniref:Uncharacterized protein n=1 Tax=Macrolepiota fuliginosa MF-IS2 TaxID=1400762 RepID=A0A9P6C768_9AGAR|nr:hypothetical protein P691DRAFT_397435 [Macrolepiota fuliginosa MF-IS2]
MLLTLPFCRSRFFTYAFGLVQYTLIYLILFPARTFAQLSNGTKNFTIALDSPQIIFTPFLCNQTTSQSTPELCRGGWVTRRENGQLMVSTTGPDPATGEIIPQMFFQFRASALYLLTSSTSNAQANITVTTNGTTISALFDSSLGAASILNLIQPSITTFALTFMPNDTPQEFTLTSAIITIPNNTINHPTPSNHDPPTILLATNLHPSTNAHARYPPTPPSSTNPNYHRVVETIQRRSCSGRNDWSRVRFD